MKVVIDPPGVSDRRREGLLECEGQSGCKTVVIACNFPQSAAGGVRAELRRQWELWEVNEEMSVEVEALDELDAEPISVSRDQWTHQAPKSGGDEARLRSRPPIPSLGGGLTVGQEMR